VRELENSIHHMVAVNMGKQVQLCDLPSAVQNHAMANCKTKFASAPQSAFAAAAAASYAPFLPQRMPMGYAEPVYAAAASGSVSPIVPLIEMERHAIIRALEFTQGDRNTAANLLGIGRTTLYRKLKEYRLVAV